MEPININSITFRKAARRICQATIAGVISIAITPTIASAADFQGKLNTVSITDSAGTNIPPVASFNYIQEGNTFTFDASSSRDDDGSIVKYSWDFGNGSSSEGVTTSYTLVDESSLSVTLTVIDDSNGVTLAQVVISSSSDITFYANADTLDTTPQKGSGPMTIDSGILLETANPIVGSGSWDNNDDRYDSIAIPLAGNLDLENGRLGFYWRPNDSTKGYIVAADVGSDFTLRIESATVMYLTYKGKFTSSFDPGLSVYDGTQAYFVEVALNGKIAELLIDGVSIQSLTAGTDTITSTTINIGSNDSLVNDAMYDQVIFSNDTTRDLNAIKNITTFN